MFPSASPSCIRRLCSLWLCLSSTRSRLPLLILSQVESALVRHPLVAEAAVVPMEHDIKGQGIYAFVTLMAGQEYPASEVPSIP